MVLAGGDTTKGSVVSISVTVVGEIGRRQAVTRSGASAGDIILLVGRLGRAQLGLELLLQGKSKRVGARRTSQAFRSSTGKSALQPHLFPKIGLALGAWLAKRVDASAMIDISDGLSTISPAYAQRAESAQAILPKAVPRFAIPAEISKLAGRLKLDPLKKALHGGEDYELLFTVSPRYLKNLRAAPGFNQLKAIGRGERAR